MLLLIILMIIAAAVLLSAAVVPLVTEKVGGWSIRKEKTLTKELDNLFFDKSPKEVIRLYFILPPLLAAVGFILGSFLFGLLGAVAGLLIPNLIIKFREKKRRRDFDRQILDAIMLLSSALKGGLSLLQALEVIVEEMPAPMSQEVGLLVRENRMGVTTEESLKHLKDRMNMEDLTMLVNAILVAREAGGDLTKVLSRLSTTIRDNRKLRENIKTLTMQGRLQGMIMSFLPILFVWWVLTFNRDHFDIMLKTDIGRFLLILAIVLQVVGMFLIKKFSTIEI